MANIPPTSETLPCYDYSCEIAKTGAATCIGAGYNGGRCWGGRFCGDGSPIIGRAPINAGRIKFVISHTPTDAFDYRVGKRPERATRVYIRLALMSGVSLALATRAKHAVSRRRRAP